MTPTAEQKVETLWTLTQFLVQQIRELHACCETYRVLLVNHNVFSQAEFDKVQVESLGEFDRALRMLCSLGLMPPATKCFDSFLKGRKAGRTEFLAHGLLCCQHPQFSR